MLVQIPFYPLLSITNGEKIHFEVYILINPDVNIYVPEAAMNMISPENQEIP